MPRFGLDVVLAHPPEWKLMKEPMALRAADGEGAWHHVRVTTNMDEACKDADIIYAKSWVSRSFSTSRRRRGALQAVQELDLRRTPHEGLCEEGTNLHALPAGDRNNEVTDAVIDGPSHAYSRKPRTGSTPARRSWRSQSRGSGFGFGVRIRTSLPFPNPNPNP